MRERTAKARDRKPRRAKRPEPSVVVRRSAIQGRGVFAARDIKRGERIIEYVGERITHAEASKRYDDEEMRRHHTFLFTVDDTLCVDGARNGNEARFINHSCTPNAYATIDRRRIYIVAKKAIRAGEEILYDYWYTVDASYSLDELRRLYPCKCGSARCRGTIAGKRPPRSKKAKVEDGRAPIAVPPEAMPEASSAGDDATSDVARDEGDAVATAE